jgi:glycosyltransferase involved in cell wall biosynthesis
VKLIPQPDWKTTIDSFKYLSKIKSSYKSAIRKSDHVFIRGNPVAATFSLYKECARHCRPVCHWIVGNPMVLLRSHKRDGIVKDSLGRLYIWQWEKKLIFGRRISNGTLLCNGQELADRYTSDKTFVTISTTLTDDDFYYRQDTCGNDVINLLCLCYVRPEKGIEYLIEALGHLQTNQPINLLIAGSRDRYANYQSKLDGLIQKHTLNTSVQWLGHVRHERIHDLMLDSDIFVLPTLSEGTPRVLVEARAKGLPIVSTNVGGIPSSVQDGYDGILVPAKDSMSLMNGINRVLHDQALRKRLIRNGYSSVKNLTIDKFVARTIGHLDNQ